jgi:hypothetical protein
VPWRDDPQVAEWASRPISRPIRLGPGHGTAPSWPGVPARRGLPLPPLLLVGLILLVICFIVGFFMPYLLPFR